MADLHWGMHSGIVIEETREAGSSIVAYFAIAPGRESAAGRDLLALILDGAEVCLRNDLDEGGEGLTSFRRVPSGLLTQTGGHGWESDWKPIDEAAFLAAIAELAKHNRGGPAAQGTIVRDKK